MFLLLPRFFFLHWIFFTKESLRGLCLLSPLFKIPPPMVMLALILIFIMLCYDFYKMTK